jgi:hypothetical protein
VRDAEGLVQVHVAHVGADGGGRSEADLGIEVGAIHVDLAAGRMHQHADFLDCFLKHAVRGGISDHQRGQPVGMRGDLRFEVGDVDVAMGIAVHHHDLQPAHLRGGRVGAVRRARDQADRAM